MILALPGKGLSNARSGEDQHRCVGAQPEIVVKTDARSEDAVLNEILRRLIAAYDPLQVYLFGSKARGEAGANSDYDLLVVVPDDAPPERRRSRLAYEALRGTGAAADVLVCTHSYFEPRRSLRASLPGTVLREGRLLHDAR